MSDQSLPSTNSNQSSVKLSSDIMTAVNKWSSAFWRPAIPSKLFDKSIISDVVDAGAKLLSATFMYGERKGKLKEIPYDDSEVGKITNLATESLWIYDNVATLDVPNDYKEEKQESFMISTGKTRKCSNCRGTGQVTCSKCGGKVQWRERQGDTIVEMTCSCGNGKERCGVCKGYSYLLAVIVCETAYKLTKTTNQEYEGEIPKNKLAQTTGRIVFEETVNYPIDKIKVMLVVGINANEYMQLQEIVRLHLHEVIQQKLVSYEGNVQLVHDLVDRFFAEIPNPAQQNKLLEYEILPVRLRVKVEDAPVSQVKYLYKSQPYKLWVYGNERKIHAPKTPFEFTSKMWAISGIILVVITVVVALILYNMGIF